MTTTTYRGVGAGALALLAPIAFAQDPAPQPARAPADEFDEASMIVERNATDGDTEVVVRATGGDDGLLWLRIRGPDGESLMNLRTHGPTNQGLREFLFESPEPDGDAILDAYPEGVYRLIGATLDGQRFESDVELSHELPGDPVILAPGDGEVVAAGALTIRWTAVPEAVQYLLEFENESADPEQTLALNLPVGTTEFEIPAALVPGASEFQVGIAAVAENGNVVWIESEFSTSP